MAAGRDTAGWRVAVPAALSLARLPFAVAFWWLGTGGRLVLIAAAAASDVLDGWAARWLDARTAWGSILDALTDKVFVFVVLVNAVAEGRLALWQLGLLLVRDAVVGAEAAWVVLWRVEPPRTEHAVAGKAATALVLVFLAVQLVWPPAAGLTQTVYWLAASASVVAAVAYARRWSRAEPLRAGRSEGRI